MTEQNRDQQYPGQLDAEEPEAVSGASGEDDNRGIVYILTHKFMPDLVKIGKTKNSLPNRMSQLNNTSIPVGWTPQLGQRRGQVKRDSRWKV